LISRRICLLTSIQRNFRFLTIWGFTMVLMATWEAQFTASSFALLNGGTAGAIYVYIGAFAGFFLAICSMAEIASMAPTTGGQYRKCSSKLEILMLLILTSLQTGFPNSALLERRSSSLTSSVGSASSAGRLATLPLAISVVPSSRAW
jgi:hypothetical protein